MLLKLLIGWGLVALCVVTGILMCGWSTGFFFAVLSRMFERPVDHQIT
jgi:hypothetical protein